MACFTSQMAADWAVPLAHESNSKSTAAVVTAAFAAAVAVAAWEQLRWQRGSGSSELHPNGRGSQVQPGWGRRCAQALPL
jgi:hypothetical protein